MSYRRFQISIAIILLLVVTLACGFNFSTAKIQDAFMARNEAGTDRTTTFAQDDIFYCLVALTNAPDDTTLKSVWYAVDVQDTEPNLLIDEASLTTGDGTIPFSLSNTALWPAGTYKVEIFMNDELDRTLEFSVQ